MRERLNHDRSKGKREKERENEGSSDRGRESQVELSRRDGHRHTQQRQQEQQQDVETRRWFAGLRAFMGLQRINVPNIEPSVSLNIEIVCPSQRSTLVSENPPPHIYIYIYIYITSRTGPRTAAAETMRHLLTLSQSGSEGLSAGLGAEKTRASPELSLSLSRTLGDPSGAAAHPSSEPYTPKSRKRLLNQTPETFVGGPSAARSDVETARPRRPNLRVELSTAWLRS